MVFLVLVQLFSVLEHFEALEVTAEQWLTVIELQGLTGYSTAVGALLLVVRIAVVAEIMLARLNANTNLNRALALGTGLGHLSGTSRIYLSYANGTRRVLPEQNTTWESKGGQLGYLSCFSAISYIIAAPQLPVQLYYEINIIYIMLPRTPQKKNSLDLEPSSQPQSHSYIFMQSTNNANVMPDSKLFCAPRGAQLQQSSPGHNNNSKVWQVKQYVHQEIQNRHGKHSQQKEKYRDVVISEQFVRSHKLYRLLKEQMDLSEARHAKHTRELQQTVASLHQEVKVAKQTNHELKVQLWEHKTQLMDLKTMLQEEEEENKKLAEEYEEAARQREDDRDEEAQNKALEEEEMSLGNFQNAPNQQLTERHILQAEQDQEKYIEARLLMESGISVKGVAFEESKELKEQGQHTLVGREGQPGQWPQFQECVNLSIDSLPKIEEHQ